MGTSNVQTYHQSTSNQNTVKLRELLKTMPSFCRDYFRGIEPTTTALKNWSLSKRVTVRNTEVGILLPHFCRNFANKLISRLTTCDKSL